MAQPFKRALGLFDAVMIVIGGIIGAGILIRVSPVQSMIGAGLMLAGIPAYYYWTAAARASARQNNRK